MNFIKFLKLSSLGLATGICALMAGCSAETPFDTDSEGILRLQMAVNSKVTRSIEDQDFLQYLKENCVVYISDTQGLLHKYVGIENVPEIIHLKSGNYVAEAWSGDSVGASYDKKFFRGYQPFEITSGETHAVVNCRIANVVMSVNGNTINPELIKDWKVTFSHSKAQLDITEETLSEKVYMMMPNADKDVKCTITGTTANGSTFTKEYIIKNVKKAHEYIVNFTYNDNPGSSQGGAFIQILIEESPITDNGSVPIYSKPSITGEEFDIESQIYAEPGEFTRNEVVKVSAFGDIDILNLSSDDWQTLGFPGKRFDLATLTENPVNTLNIKGISWIKERNESKNICLEYITFSSQWLNSLPKREKEYVIEIEAHDPYGKSNEVKLRIAVGEDAVEVTAPATPDPVDPSDYMAVLTHSATVPVTVNDPAAPGLALQYREAGTTAWQTSQLRSTRAKTKMYADLTNLKASTRYEYRVIADGYESPSQYLTTEGKFIIPNASMEEWSDYAENNKVLIPGANGERTFWDSGNHGSATMSVTLTKPNTDIFHTGTKSAQLRSQFVGVGSFGKFAAGNLFAGTYKGTDGTDGILEFGRSYDGSHPTALSVWVNYRPQAAVNKKGAGSHLGVGEQDKGQIYIALSTEPVEIRTKSSNQKLFSKDDPCILAYGQYTFEGDYGSDGQLKQLSIPFDYYERAKSNKPMYLIIVCSASIYGDYFEGGEGSMMIVDDFELVY